MKLAFTRRELAITALAASALWSARARAQAIPKLLRIVVAYPAGGVSDNVARALGEKLAAQLGTTVVIENRAGASGSIGMDAVAKSAPDGATLCFSATSPLVLNPHLAKSPFDPLKDIVPVASVMYSPVLLLGHIVLAQLRASTGIDVTHVPYKGGGQQLTDALGGQFEILSTNAGPTLTAHIQGGKLRALAVGAPARLESMPGVPTLGELGFETANLSSLFGVFAPARTPGALVERYNAEINRALESPELRGKLLAADNVPTTRSAVDFAKAIAAEYESNGRIIKAANIKPE
jgi:tripartite-type tricarboxylate transporter receptor subunit TctC